MLNLCAASTDLTGTGGAVEETSPPHQTLEPIPEELLPESEGFLWSWEEPPGLESDELPGRDQVRAGVRESREGCWGTRWADLLKRRMGDMRARKIP